MPEDQGYEAPALTEIGTLHELTLQFDKIGDTFDFITGQVPSLDGSIVPDD